MVGLAFPVEVVWPLVRCEAELSRIAEDRGRGARGVIITAARSLISARRHRSRDCLGEDQGVCPPPVRLGFCHALSCLPRARRTLHRPDDPQADSREADFTPPHYCFRRAPGCWFARIGIAPNERPGANGEWSHSGGRSGACSDHGGETGNTRGNTDSTGSVGTSTANAGSGTGNTGADRGSGPLSTVDSYWSSISNQDYSSAYSNLAPGTVSLTQAQFVSEEKQAGIQSVSFAGHVTAQTTGTATVAVDGLTTKDKQFGCRTWSGSYQLVDQSGQWLIKQANITPQRCGG